MSEFEISEIQNNEKCKCTGCCRCCPCLNIAQNITTENDITTITIESGLLVNLQSTDKLCIGLFTTLPSDNHCNYIQVSDGTTTLKVYDKYGLYQPCHLCSHNILVLRYFTNPKSLILQKNNYINY